MKKAAVKDPNAPATKSDISAVKADISQVNKRIDDVNERLDILRSEVNHGYADLKEGLRDIQTEMLKAFYNYSQTTDLKLRDHDAADHMARQRLSVLESRVTDIERRLLMPPEPAN